MIFLTHCLQKHLHGLVVGVDYVAVTTIGEIASDGVGAAGGVGRHGCFKGAWKGVGAEANAPMSGHRPRLVAHQ